MLFDIVGNLIFSPVRLFHKKNKRIDDIKNILIIRTAFIGDIIMTLPILKPLKEKFPHAKIGFVASKEGCELLKGNPYIDKLYPFNPFWFYGSSKKEYLDFIREMRKEQFDLIIEARGDIREILFLAFPLRSRFKLSYGFGGGTYLLTHIVPFQEMKHRIEYHLDMARYLGCRTEGIDWAIHLTEDEKKRVGEILDSNKIRRPFIAVHPGSRLPLKRWSDEKYAALYDNLIGRYGIPLLILGSGKEKAIVQGIVKDMKHRPIMLTGELSLRELAGVLSGASLFICNDSAPMHIAAAMKTPTVALFGPSKSIETAPYGNINRIVEKEYPCRYGCDESSCHNERFHACMQDIAVEDVLEAVEDIFKELKLNLKSADIAQREVRVNVQV